MLEDTNSLDAAQLIVIVTVIRAVTKQHSSPELRLTNKTKMHLKQKKKMNI